MINIYWPGLRFKVDHSIPQRLTSSVLVYHMDPGSVANVRCPLCDEPITAHTHVGSFTENFQYFCPRHKQFGPYAYPMEAKMPKKNYTTKVVPSFNNADEVNPFFDDDPAPTAAPFQDLEAAVKRMHEELAKAAKGTSPPIKKSLAEFAETYGNSAKRGFTTEKRRVKKTTDPIPVMIKTPKVACV